MNHVVDDDAQNGGVSVRSRHEESEDEREAFHM
jgi:hypothetical protein